MNQLTQFDFNGEPLRVVDVQGEPWFVAKDVCDVLDLYVKDVNSRLDDDEKSYVARTDLGLMPGKPMAIFSESGLYAAIMQSRKKEAQPFRKWVTSEVLPSIRKHGAYMTHDTLENVLGDPDFMIGTSYMADAMEVNTVNARELWAGLGVSKDFSDWIKAQIERARLTEGRDFIKVPQKGERKPGVVESHKQIQ